MKQAIEKSTGAVIDGFLFDGGFLVIKNGVRSHFLEVGEYDLIIESKPLPTTEPDWNQIKIQAAIAAMQGMIANPNIKRPTGEANLETELIQFSSIAIEYADSLITELKKQTK